MPNYTGIGSILSHSFVMGFQFNEIVDIHFNFFLPWPHLLRTYINTNNIDRAAPGK